MKYLEFLDKRSAIDTIRLSRVLDKKFKILTYW